tara:strand:- start:271 stop:669 length:399 start_codon:yes stop_codon:yes gene_type:complete
MSKEFFFEVKVYYEDTDSGGVVYYANYLKFLERARSEMISSIGLNNTKLLNEHGVLVIVKSCNIDYKKPARLEDVLKISSKIISSTRTSFAMKQIISKQSDIISEAEVKLVCIDSKGKPVQIPNAINDLIKS